MVLIGGTSNLGSALSLCGAPTGLTGPQPPPIGIPLSFLLLLLQARRRRWRRRRVDLSVG